MVQIVHCKDFNEMSALAAKAAAEEIAKSNGHFSLLLCGGDSVTGALQELSGCKTSWQGINAFMADERFVPCMHRLSNYRQAHELFFSKAPGINAVPFEVEKGVADYEKKFLQATNGKVNLALLGVGEDGHIASLFPYNAALKEQKIGYIEVHDSPKPPPYRVTITPKAIEEADATILLFAADSKKAAFQKFSDGKTQMALCPAKMALNAKKCTVFTAFGGKDAE